MEPGTGGGFGAERELAIESPTVFPQLSVDPLVLGTVSSKQASAASDRSLSSLAWIAVVLAALTGGIHLWLGVADGKGGLVVAGAGFLVGIGLVVLDRRRASAIELGIPFVAVQILLYALMHGFLKASAPTFAPIELIDKAVQAALLVVLVVLRRRAE